jgi:hypothetical protein
VYSAKTAAAIVVEPVVTARIAAEPRQRRVTIESSNGGSAKPLSEINPPPIDIDDDIPF